MEEIITSKHLDGDNSLIKMDGVKKGYLENVIIKGKTLQNLVTGVVKTTEQFRNFCFSDLLKPNTTYTLIINNTSDTNYNCYFNEENFTTDGNLALPKGISIKKTTTKNTIVNNTLLKNFTGGNQSFTLDSIMLLEGEPKEIPPYFEGIKSTGELEGNKISILSSKVFSKIEQGAIDATNGNEADSNARCRTDYIEVIENGYLNIINANSWCSNIVIFYDKDKKYIKSNTNGFSKETKIKVISNACYARIAFSINATQTNLNPSQLKDIIIASTADKTEILLEEPLSCIEGNCDTFDLYNEKYTMKNGYAKFTGRKEENWKIKNTDGIIGFEFSAPSVISNNDFVCMCDNMVALSYNDWNKSNESCVASSKGSVFIKIKNISTVENLKLELQKKPVTFYIQLQTPIEKTIRLEKNLIRTFENGYLQLDNTITPIMTCDYPLIENSNTLLNYIDENGSLHEININASDIEALDIDGNFDNNNLEDILALLGGADRTYVVKNQEEIDNGGEGLYFNIEDILDNREDNDVVKRLKDYFSTLVGDGVTKKESIIYKNTFSGNEDLNDIIEPGIYQINIATNMSHKPKGNNSSYSILEVIASDTYVKQIYSSAVSGTEFTRTKTEHFNDWNDWKQSAITDKMPIILTPNPGFKFISQNNCKINNRIHFNFRLAKSDDSVFSKDSLNVIILPEGLVSESSCISSSGLQQNNMWLGQTMCVFSPINNVVIISVISDNVKQVMCSGSVVI